MGRSRFKWKCIFISYLVFLNVFSKSLPIYETKSSSISTTDTVFKNVEVPLVTDAVEDSVTIRNADNIEAESDTEVNLAVNLTSNLLRQNVRPGQRVTYYTVTITNEGNSFSGRVIIDIIRALETRDDPFVLHAEGIVIENVLAGTFTPGNAVPADFFQDGPTVEISPASNSLEIILVIEYTGQYSNNGRGLHRGEFNEGEGTYVSMNLHPTYARHVFPCMDEPTEGAMIKFTFNNFDEFTHLHTNSAPDAEENEYHALEGPPHVWGMVAHNFVTMNLPTASVLLYGRSVSNQHDQASIAINSYFNNLNEWTSKPFFDINVNQDGSLHIVALPDVSEEWHSLSTIGIWEPYIFMENQHSIAQRKTAFFEIAKAISKPWFGAVIYPENWRNEWIINGFATYSAYEMMRMFQADFETDVTLLDVNTLFVADVIQESLLRDAYINSQVLQPEEPLFEDAEIRDHIYGLLKYKAPALMRMMRIVLGDPEQDFIQSAAQALLGRTSRPLQTVNSFNFEDAVKSSWEADGNHMIGDFGEYLEPWIQTTGYPVLHVTSRQGGVMIMQERFSFVTVDHQAYLIPITYTTSLNPDFDNFQPVLMSESSSSLNFALGDDDWVVFNIQGQGYYRVNYEPDLWEKILDALNDPERREEIHPLNRATLVDDALNLARTGRLVYDIAFRVVLSMEHETEYAVWKAFVRNMDFLKRRLEALVADDEDLDPDIYLRMVRRTIITVEDELGFYPDISFSEPAMATLTRGLVMDHACRAGYDPCIAAAVDWFYDPDADEPTVNPAIPHDIRPAVYCTMAREGDEEVIAALYARLEIEPTMYERVVILESLACSRDEGFIRRFLDETIIAQNNPYSVEERSKILAAVARASNDNAFLAIDFMSRRTSEIRDHYGGPEKLEELFHIVADYMADDFLSSEFRIWVNSQTNNLDDSQDSAIRALAHVNHNLEWDAAHLMDVYEWIDENDASTMVLSLVALFTSVMVALLNH